MQQKLSVKFYSISYTIYCTKSQMINDLFYYIILITEMGSMGIPYLYTNK